MQSRGIFMLLFAVALVSAAQEEEESSNTLVQATPADNENDEYSPACTQSVDVQQRTTQNPNAVTRRSMSGAEFLRGSLPRVNTAGQTPFGRLLANALRNFFVHPESLRLRNKRYTSSITGFFFRPPKTRVFDDDYNSTPTASTVLSSSTTPNKTTTTHVSVMTSTQTPQLHRNRVMSSLQQSTTILAAKSTSSLSQQTSATVISTCVSILVMLLNFIFVYVM